MQRSTAPPVERRYHHGDLRRAIVEAALDTVRETQSIELSLRELARRAGVSHNAPYKHFAEKRDLLAAISAAGFELLTKRMADESAKPGSPRARLMAMARAYMRHGVENPALYRLMFGGHLSTADAGRPPIERAAAEEAKILFSSAIADGALGQPIPKTAKNQRKLDGAILACWSLLHGLTLLLADGVVGPREKYEALCESLVQGLLDGLINKVPALPPGTWVGPPMSSG